MFASLSKLVRRLSDRSAQDARQHAQRRRQGVRLAVERLEERALMAADFNDQTAEAMYGGSISSTTTVTRTSTIDNGADVDLWEINLPTISAGGEYVEFDLDRTSGNLDSYLRIFDSSGRQLASNDDASAPGEGRTTMSYLMHRFTTPGRYYVGVSAYGNDNYNAVTGSGDWQGTSSTTGGFRLTITGKGHDLDDQIREITPFRAMMGTVQGTDVDMYQFMAEAGERFQFIVSNPGNPTANDIRLRVFDSAGREIPKTGLVYQFTADGTYYLGVSRTVNSSYNPVTGAGDRAGPSFGGDYNVSIREIRLPVFYHDMPAETRNQDLFYYGGIGGSLIRGNQVNMYRFEVTGERHDVRLYTSLPAGGTANLVVRLFNAEGQQFREVAVDPSPLHAGATHQHDRHHVMLDPGVYYVGVSVRGNNSYDPMTGAGLVNAAGIGRYYLHADSLAESMLRYNPHWY